MSDLRPLLTLPEVAKQLRVSVSTLRAWRSQGKFSVIKLPSGTVRVHPDELDRIVGAPTPLED